MTRGLIYEEAFRPQFSGHETFPLRYGWLKKVFDAVEGSSGEGNNKSVFLADEAIASFGVGKNMVTSMRYWALAARVIIDESKTFKGPFRTTSLAKGLLSDRGWDPFLEEPASLWWLHWQFASRAAPTTTIYYAFNHYHAATFYREQLLAELSRYCDAKGLTDIATFTLKRDVDCFVRTYAARIGGSEEESLESLMCELGLLQPIGKRDGFIFARGPKPTLPDAVFLYALVEFARARDGARTFRVEALMHEPGAPGRVFMLDESSLLERLGLMDELSKGRIRWSETAGLRQVSFHVDPSEIDTAAILESAYRGRRRQRHAA
jgi:hypothetical protein